MISRSKAASTWYLRSRRTSMSVATAGRSWPRRVSTPRGARTPGHPQIGSNRVLRALQLLESGRTLPPALARSERREVQNSAGGKCTAVQLVRVHASAGRTDQALGKLAGGLQKNPQKLTALMPTGILYEQKGEIPKAREAYEKILAQNARVAPAANNLAWLLTEHGGDQARALQARPGGARGQARGAPRRGHPRLDPSQARDPPARHRPPQGESAAKLPDRPEAQYHLGPGRGEGG
jgi:Flp pilus assembly protein TadD